MLHQIKHEICLYVFIRSNAICDAADFAIVLLLLLATHVMSVHLCMPIVAFGICKVYHSVFAGVDDKIAHDKILNVTDLRKVNALSYLCYSKNVECFSRFELAEKKPFKFTILKFNSL